MKPLLFSFLMAAVSPIALASGNQASCIDNVTASCQEKASEYWDSVSRPRCDRAIHLRSVPK